MGVWWNGRHGRLKIYSVQAGGGSNPLTPTIIANEIY